MDKKLEIREETSAYGSKGQAWHPEFVSYMVAMVKHPVYAGMPDAVKPDGKIQWEAPSNRKTGKYQFTHQRRLEWWQQKAREIGIDPTSDQWISRTAKTIHPTGMKPCKRCGRNVGIAYAYPNAHIKRRLSRLLGADFYYDPIEPVDELVQRIVDGRGVEALEVLPALLRTRMVETPDFGQDLEKWLLWIDETYIPAEPGVLSPGCMSNAPDRFDGFHSFNICCRKKADRGRHDANMRYYSTDRRVFEYWAEGDWIAADRLMGLITARFRDEECADGGQGPCTADHIGPLSLGFAHRPEFRLLSRSANSAKNNRMTLHDVRDLMLRESEEVTVASWYARPLWDRRKHAADNEESALRLSKLLRDNQRAAMHVLLELFNAGHLAFLASLLELEFADFKVSFVNLRIEDFLTKFDRIEKTRRDTKYASEQKARRLRIGFEALRAYETKDNRHDAIVEQLLDGVARDRVEDAAKLLSSASEEVLNLDRQLAEALAEGNSSLAEQRFRAFSSKVPTLEQQESFQRAKAALVEAMEEVARRLEDMWDTDRYIRPAADADDD